MTSFSKTSLYYKHLIIAIYLSAFEMIVRGILRQYGLEFVAIGAIQGWVYLVPIFLRIIFPIKDVLNPKSFKILVLVQLFYVLLVVAPHNITNGTYSLLFKGIKNFYLPLVIYYGIFSYLTTTDHQFERKFLSHIFKIGIIAGLFTSLEVVLLVTGKGAFFLSYIRQASINFQQAELEGIRPVGLFLGHHMSALFFALLAVLSLGLRLRIMRLSPTLLFYFFFISLLITTTKTFIIAFIVYYFLSVLVSYNINRYLKAFALVGFFAVFVGIVHFQWYRDINYSLFDQSKSKLRMVDKFDELEWFLENSVLPNGFLPEGLGEEENIYVDPIYEDGEIYAYKLAYRIGIVGFLMYFFTVFWPLCTLRIRRMILNPYSAAFFVCAFGFLHYLPMFILINFSVLIFASTMLRKQNLERQNRIVSA